MSASLGRVGRFIKRWAGVIILGGVAATFVTALVFGVILSTETAHQLDVSDQSLDKRLATLPTDSTPQPFPVDDLEEISPDWDIICYVGSGWVSKALRKALNNPLDGYHYEPRDIYGVEDYWVIAFVDIESKTVHSIEVDRNPIKEITGPSCLDRDSAKIAAADDPALSNHIDLAFVGEPAELR